MLISKIARKYALNTQYALNKEGKILPHPQKCDASLVAHVHDRKRRGNVSEALSFFLVLGHCATIRLPPGNVAMYLCRG